jgi:hypothetical protein
VRGLPIFGLRTLQRSKGSRQADLQAKLDAARRLHEIVNLRMETRLPAETLRGLARGRDFFASPKRRLRRADEVGQPLIECAA